MTTPAIIADLASPDWLLAGFDQDKDLFHFAQVSRATYQQSPFLDHRIQPLPTNTRTIPGAQADELLRLATPDHAGWIFHTGFCCSTLLASCLDHPGATLAVREPKVLSQLAQWKRNHSVNSPAVSELLCQRIIGLTERSYPGEKLLIKPSNFANNLLGDAHKASARIVLMSSGLNSLLVSMLKKQSEAEAALPNFLNALMQDSDYLQRIGLAEIHSLDLLKKSVVFWHCQRYFLQKFRDEHPDSEFLQLSMERFLAHPLETLAEVAAFLELGLTDSVLEQTVTSGAFTRHSKNQATTYGSSEHRKEQQQTSARFEAEIGAALAWAQPMLEKLPVRPIDAFEMNAPAA